MTNNGTAPDLEKVDLRFRNGQIRRGANPKLWRWRPWEWGRSDWDIIDWQKGKD